MTITGQQNFICLVDGLLDKNFRDKKMVLKLFTAMLKTFDLNLAFFNFFLYDFFLLTRLEN